MQQSIGDRLRAVRISLNLSQRALARAGGVANATISQIEAGVLNPTVSMLKRILDAVPISLSEFFADEFQPREQIFFSATELAEIGDGGVSYRQVGRHLAGRAIQLLHECYQPGAKTGRHALVHQGEECGIILEGQLEVTVGNDVRELRTGDAYYFRSTEPHRFRNTGRGVCRLVTACTPPTF